jgi:hypothetical protein
MGLDMYLTKKTYVQNWDFMEPKDRTTVTIEKNGEPIKGINLNKIKYVEEEVMYWRKANQIHNWFVQNVQNGDDNCGTYYLDSEQLGELRDLCGQVLEVLNRAPKKTISIESGWSGGERTYCDIEVYDCGDELEDLLPPTSGFFFGSNEIDEWYKENIENTFNLLNEELESDGSGDYYYHSSW